MSYNLGYNNPAPDDGDYLVYKNRKMLQEYASSNVFKNRVYNASIKSGFPAKNKKIFGGLLSFLNPIFNGTTAGENTNKIVQEIAGGAKYGGKRQSGRVQSMQYAGNEPAYNIGGQYYRGSHTFTARPDRWFIGHEMGHGFRPIDWMTTNEESLLGEAINSIDKTQLKDPLYPTQQRKDINYFLDPEEVYANMWAVRSKLHELYGIKPSDTYTEDTLEKMNKIGYFQETPFKYMFPKNKKKILDLFNLIGQNNQKSPTQNPLMQTNTNWEGKV